MMRLIKCIALLLLITSCNSNETKNKANYSSKNESETKTDPKLKASITEGKSIYNNFCISCHMPNGKGVPRAFPPLADSDYLRKNQVESIKAVKNGMSGKIVVNDLTYNSVMASLGLSDKEVADVMNYINNSWGNKIDNFVTSEKVSKL
ncbi:c-type cytochrome [Winogradskyella sp. UBA3174]|uniref:c-type cytochrome n=1 Tax=Winogradskyella sp. UBA3174 TaxID=1947785 RepID=UPI0025CD0157|nr:cytochrome c [Winogradskyella sp. UBA3174]